VSESDWSYINDKWGWDEDGMPNFMNTEAFHEDQRRQFNKSLTQKSVDSNTTEKEFYESGVLKSEKKYYQHKLLNSIEYFENGNRKEYISYSNNKDNISAHRIGSITNYYENGNKKYSASYDLLGNYSLINSWYKNGRLNTKNDFTRHLETNYAENGMKSSEGRFVFASEEFKKDGKWTFWLTNPDNEYYQEWYTENYINDKLEGKFYRYDKNSNLREQGNYKDNMMHGKWLQYDENGQIIKDYFYKKDKLIVKNPAYK
jgi:antitoxin component YwqK of YwqJK toxin-antitoxin module